METPEEQSTSEITGLIHDVPRIYLGQSLTLASLLGVMLQLRRALGGAPGRIEVDSRDLTHLSEGASLVLWSSLDRAERDGFELTVLAAN